MLQLVSEEGRCDGGQGPDSSLVESVVTTSDLLDGRGRRRRRDKRGADRYGEGGGGAGHPRSPKRKSQSGQHWEKIASMLKDGKGEVEDRRRHQTNRNRSVTTLGPL